MCEINIKNENELKTLIESVVTATVTAMNEKRNSAPEKPRYTAYHRTEQLLYNYQGFKRVLEERMEEIEEIKKHGVPTKGGAVVEYTAGGKRVQGLVLDEERVDAAVRVIQDSVEETVRVIALIDKCMASLKRDPYYDILEMRYFEGRTLEDIGVYFGCDHTTISRNKSRLVKELAMRIFPDEVIKDYMTS